MSAFRRRGVPYGGNDRHSYQPHARDDFYDDRRSRSRSPERPRRSPPYDISRGRPSSRGSDYQPARSPDRWRDRSREIRNDYRRGSPSPRRDRGYYDRDRPREEPRIRRPVSRAASATSEDGRPSSRGRPSKEIMMEGVAPHITESDISSELRQHYKIDNLDDVRIIRDRQTKQSREFGFLRFSTIDDAQAFMDQNYPTLYLYGDSSKSSGNPDEAKVHISYGRERKENKSDESDWNCSSCHINNYANRMRCFRCQAPRTGKVVPPQAYSETDVPEFGSVGGSSKAANIGDNDASPENIPSQFLLFRGLEPSVSEEHFAKGVAKLNKPAGLHSQQSQPSTKKPKVASTTGDGNLGAKEGTLRRVLLVRDRQSNESWRYGFAEYATIEDAQAAVVRYNSFDRFTIASKPVMVSYIHAGVFVPVLTPIPSTERFLFSPIGNPAVKLQYWDEEAYVTELMLSKVDVASNGRAGPTIPAESEGFKPMKDNDKAKKRKAVIDANTPSTKKAPSQLQFWSNRHAELHGIDKNKSSAPSSDAGDDAPPSQSFADPVRLCCYLCMRQFEDMATLNKHERISSLHRQNLKDLAKVEKAKHKLKKHDVGSSDQSTTLASEYRDRAKERRKIYGVVNKKGEQVGKLKPSLDNSEDEKATAAPSKGASLLSKMGYTAGQGLGASGEGMKEALKQDVYMAGVGLGAQGGKVGDAVEEAERNTKDDYKSWVEKGRNNARERYRNMG